VSLPAIPAVFVVPRLSRLSYPPEATLASYLHRRELIDISYVTDLAALGGAALGGFTSFATSWTTLRIQMNAEQTTHSKSRRQMLYKEFIDQASISMEMH
jgi:hypothetical protein